MTSLPVHCLSSSAIELSLFNRQIVVYNFLSHFLILFFFFFFFFSSRRRHTRLVSDWSSDVCSSDLLTAFFYCFQKLVKSLGKEAYAVFSKLSCDLINGNPNTRERRHNLARAFDVFRQTLAGVTVVSEGIECRGRHRVYGIRTDHFFDVHHIAVAGILGAGAGPEHALSLRAFRDEFLPSISAENL